jgi:energy-coupling factor transporter ATP-binding protein EcfA2
MNAHMSVYDHILKFASNCELWIQDLIRRIVVQPNLSGKDLDEAYSMLLCKGGLFSNEKSLVPEPLTKAHTPFRPTGKQKSVRLGELKGLTNVNRLVSGQSLIFALDGLTVIYGDNGSGKSGYCRVLKQACRARREAMETVLGDVYKTGTNTPAKATIGFLLDGVPQDAIEWIDGKPAPAALSQISIFDAATVPIYAEKQNEIEFLPQGLDVMPRLGRALEELLGRLDQEINTTKISAARALPTVGAATSIYKLFERIQQGLNLPSHKNIEDVAKWGNSDETRLKEVERQLLELAEPQKVANQQRRIKKSIEYLADVIRRILLLTNDNTFAQVKETVEKLSSASEAASIAASEQFAKEPLGKSVGTNAWRNLFEYARQFSLEAYPGEQFPVVGSDKYCPLCQQPLGEDASQRLLRFQRYISDTSQEEVRKQEGELNSIVENLKKIAVISDDDLRTQLAEATANFLNETEIESSLLFYALLRERRNALIAYLEEKAALPTCENLLPSPCDGLKGKADKLEADAVKYEGMLKDSSLSMQLRSELEELKAKKILSENLALLIQVRDAMDKLQKLDSCRRACDTRQVSLMNSQLRDKYLTIGFENKLKEEVAGFQLGYIPLKVRAKTDRGSSFIGIALNKSGTAKTSQILSEGEYRGLALACFLAEIDAIPGHDGIIVDDPVSSLDHLHVSQVAHRLVAEAKKRQVMVFTHDLSFFYELREAAAEVGVGLINHWLSRKQQDCGLISQDESPWQVMKVKDRAKELEKKLHGIPDQATCKMVVYESAVCDFYSSLRETWERLVEERLFNGVVGRFQPSVKTQSLKGVVVEDDDYKKIYFAMAKASNYSGHDQAVGRRASFPNRKEMMEDLEDLRKYDKELGARAEKVGVARKLLEEPSKAKTLQREAISSPGTTMVTQSGSKSVV